MCVVSRVADGQRRVGDALPAAEQRSVGRRMAGPLHKGAARNGERGFFVQEVDGRRRRDDIAALIVARQVEFYLVRAVVARAAQPELLAVLLGVLL